MAWFFAYVIIGAVAGFFSGLLGIGGGVIIVPLLAMLFDWQGLPREHVFHLAVGSAMASILFTSVASARAHARRGGVRWDIARLLTPGILIGGPIGSGIAAMLSTRVFAACFTALMFAAATTIWLDRKPKPGRALPGPGGMFAVGFGISVISALSGIGGALFSVPYLIWCNVPVLGAVGTASLIGFPIAFGSSIGHALTGSLAVGLPPLSLGFIYLPAVAGISVASVLTAPLGARVAHAVPTTTLKRLFALVMFAVGAKMLSGLWA